ncbi:MAG: glycosyltransferase [Pedosphaera sp.]|nr:glycosyltransferase [Pedosphaera sp.]
MISIVTPVLNGARTIERTLRAMSTQQADFEHIVQDGGSTDGTLEILKRYATQYPLRIFQEKDTGLYDAINRGMNRARGDVLGWINADDFHLPWTLATVQSVLDRNRSVHWITGIPSWYFEDTGLSVTASAAPVFPRSWIAAGWFANGRLGALQQESMFWRRWLWEKAAPTDLMTRYRYAADFHLWKRFAQHADLRTVSSVLSCFTLSSDQISTRFLREYQSECGIPSTRIERALWARLVTRLTSIIQFRQVLKPCAVRR